MSNPQAAEDADKQFEKRLLELYPVDDKPYSFDSLAFEDLPSRAQQFLLRNELVLPDSDSLQSLTLEERNFSYNKLLAIRIFEQSVLGRNMAGVHREIVDHMSPSSSTVKEAEEKLEILYKVLIPEWKRHLDDGLEKIDALIWFERRLTDDTPSLFKPLQHYLCDRKVDVGEMVKIAVMALQSTKQQVDRETGLASVLLAQTQPNDGRTESDASWTDADIDSASDNDSGNSGHGSEYDEDLSSSGSEITFDEHNISLDNDSEGASCWKDSMRRWPFSSSSM